MCIEPSSSSAPSGSASPRPQFAKEPGSNASRNDEFTDLIKPLLANYCQECHWGEDAESELDLSKFDTMESVRNDHPTWEKIVDAISTDLMPPEDSPRPTDAEVEQIRSWFLQSIADNPNAQVPVSTIRRLNRTEYENSVRDLLRLRNDVFDNPNQVVITTEYFQPSTHRMPDYVLAMSCNSYAQRKPGELPGISELPGDPPVMHGFNNDQTTLSLSPVYMEASLALAQSIVNDENFPHQTQLRDSLFVAADASDGDLLTALARQRLTTFLARAFRRPATGNELDRYSNLFRRELEKSDYTQAMKTTVAAILASPSFLFRRDRATDEGGNDFARSYAMASRLSYFLWGSMPDDELFQAAAEGRLSTDADILVQVRRMMVDRKIKSLATDFGMQWLKLNKVNSARPDKDLFPGWYRKDSDSPGVSMMIEQLLLFETILVEDRSILDFINADFSYLNRSLMDWYYIEPEKLIGYKPDTESFEDFFRIQWPTRHRGGIVASGAMLVSTSATTRTSPVYRGAWILEVVFNQPPPPPPPNVPALDGDGTPGKANTNVREKLAVHRANATCAVCHDRIDPVGFALENFDPVGRFRKTYPDGSDIDATGQLDGEVYEGAARFKNVILRQKDRFVLGFVKHVAQYALGRALRITDEPELERIAARVAEREYRFSVVIEEIALSKLFRTSMLSQQD